MLILSVELGCPSGLLKSVCDEHIIMIQLSDSEFEQLELIVAQIADLAGSQGFNEIEVLTESALAIIEQAKVAAYRAAQQERDRLP